MNLFINKHSFELEFFPSDDESPMIFSAPNNPLLCNEEFPIELAKDDATSSPQCYSQLESLHKTLSEDPLMMIVNQLNSVPEKKPSISSLLDKCMKGEITGSAVLIQVKPSSFEIGVLMQIQSTMIRFSCEILFLKRRSSC